MKSNESLKEICSKNCIKYTIITVLLNPIVILGVWWYSTGFDIPLKTATILVTVIIIFTIIIPIKLLKLRKNNEIGKVCSIFLFILWIVPFICTLLISWSCALIELNWWFNI